MNLPAIRKLIKDKLQLVIKSDYILIDLPYFQNVGDILIWQATLDLLKEISYKCLYSCSLDSYIKPKKIDSNILIILMGGGNYGDLWIRHQEFRHQILNDFPYNPILQLPQSVHFTNETYFKKDIHKFSQHHGKIDFFLRDLNSYNIITTHYKNVNAHLVPDIVFSFNIQRWTKPTIYNQNQTLFVCRQDKERNTNPDIFNIIPQNAIKADWPPMEKNFLRLRVYNKFLYTFFIPLDKYLNTQFSKRFMDFYYKYILKDYIIRSGIKFINAYETIYTTRLHAAIIALLLKKEVYIFDNSYGKIKGAFSHSLLLNAPIHFIEKNNG
ncbi:polysaccharide pyruvyl transferase family protein [Phocaeicola plebeius]|uniref:polysaccharide pyruvyl transferase family protein n=1 Tax=Phocaeicola plebeius TaxID=310297 RepID=UPI001958C2C4|nr:polysaccharide pyruvyl transferase family protein [Phocaeicola plebeius]MBM6845216.1 polysaccharide pyruvyl transferase family protein [Phocaeicola plebeius]